MKKVNPTPQQWVRQHFNSVGQLVRASPLLQRVLGQEPAGAPPPPPQPQPPPPPPGTSADVHAASAPLGDAAGGSFNQVALRHAGVLRHYKLCVPSVAPAVGGRALLVLLHGCTQDPDDFARGTGMNALAAQHGFLVLYPQQTEAQHAHRCWNWFRPGDQLRGSGEPALLMAMVADVLRRHRVEPRQVFVAGLSAGGAMAAVLGQQYPDVFAAVGVHSGLAAGAAHDVMSAFSAMKNGAKERRLAQLPGPPTIVFHGDADRTVHPRNGLQVIAAAVCTAPALQTQLEQGTQAQRSYTRSLQRSADGRISTEHWALHGAGHAWSGGAAAGSYTDPLGPNASREMLRFFLAHPRRDG